MDKIWPGFGSVVVFATMLALGASATFAQRAPSGPPSSALPQTQWADEFGQTIANRVLEEAKKNKAGGTTGGPIEVTVRFKVTPYGPSVEKPTWAPDDIKSFDVCAQICTGWSCYLQCSGPKVNIDPPLLRPTTGTCDAIRLRYFKELWASGCLGTSPKLKPAARTGG